MKLNLLLEYQRTLILLSWARETSLGVYMGVRFSPGVENVSYFANGERELLQFPLMPDGKRRRAEAPLAQQSPIAAIETSELILERLVDVCGPVESSPAPAVPPGTTEITVGEDDLRDKRWLSYQAHIVRDTWLEAFRERRKKDVAVTMDGRTPLEWIHPLTYFPGYCYVLSIRR